MTAAITFPSRPEIRPYVEYFYHVHEENAGRGIALPETKYDLVFNHGSRGILSMGGQQHRISRVVLTGMNEQAVSISPQDCIRASGVKFKAHGLHPFLGIPMNHVSNDIHDATSLFEANVLQEVENRLHEAHSNDERTSLIEQFLMRRLRHPCDLRVMWATSRIQHQKGRVSVRRLAEDANLSERRLRDLFRKHIGTSPKSYSRLVRFSDLIKSFRNPQNAKQLSRLALDVGYYDQPHFIREFRRITEKTPRQFVLDMQTSESYNY